LKRVLEESGKIFEKGVEILSSPHVQRALMDLEEVYESQASHKRIAEQERQLMEELERSIGRLTGLESRVVWMMEKGKMPLRRLEQRACFLDVHGHRVALRFPNTIRDWTASVNGKDADHAVLFVTLRDLEERGGQK
jgi:hypothetical protein